MLVKTSVLPALVPVSNQTCPVHWCAVLAVAVLVAQCCMRGSASPLRSAPRKVCETTSGKTGMMAVTVCPSHGCCVTASHTAVTYVTLSQTIMQWRQFMHTTICFCVSRLQRRRHDLQAWRLMALFRWMQHLVSVHPFTFIR